jgi:hypothetical protein
MSLTAAECDLPYNDGRGLLGEATVVVGFLTLLEVRC